MNLENAGGGKIGHYGEREVALQTEDEFGWEKAIGLPLAKFVMLRHLWQQLARSARRGTLFNRVREKKIVSS